MRTDNLLFSHIIITMCRYLYIMCTRKDTTINHVTGLAEELLEYKSYYAIFFSFFVERLT